MCVWVDEYSRKGGGGQENESKKEWRIEAISSFELTESNQSVWK